MDATEQVRHLETRHVWFEVIEVAVPVRKHRGRDRARPGRKIGKGCAKNGP